MTDATSTTRVYSFSKETLAWHDEAIRASDRARQYLRPGDRITYEHCPGPKRWGVFVCFDGHWACTKTRNDVVPMCITKVNNVPVDFTDKGVCSSCSMIGMGGWNGCFSPRSALGGGCNAIGCPYQICRQDPDDDIPL
ncbi:hypothetical protein [uncultured Martelella sp.]|uniref:hypothetical protein n=1 Tax=uncultured Martelella sp. TaxID=392331 RepID=UPI0029C80E37|nr:hypothetical protein [uncultured Martelella sp.]